ncbi:MAG: PEP-CTERM sorting domain-containing protein [Burkholderiales bacterium]
MKPNYLLVALFAAVALNASAWAGNAAGGSAAASRDAEPRTPALMFAGLGVIGLIARRRRAD